MCLNIGNVYNYMDFGRQQSLAENIIIVVAHRLDPGISILLQVTGLKGLCPNRYSSCISSLHKFLSAIPCPHFLIIAFLCLTYLRLADFHPQIICLHVSSFIQLFVYPLAFIHLCIYLSCISLFEKYLSILCICLSHRCLGSNVLLTDVLTPVDHYMVTVRQRCGTNPAMYGMASKVWNCHVIALAYCS